MDCSCQEEAKYPKLLLNYLYLRREKIPDQQMLAMTLEEFNNREIDLEEEYDHVQNRSKYVLEEIQGRDLLRQLDTGVPAADLVLNDAGGGGNEAPDPDPGQGMDVDSEAGDQAAHMVTTDESYQPSEPEEPQSPKSVQNRGRFHLTSLAQIHHGISNRALSEVLTCAKLDEHFNQGTWHPSMIVDHNKVFCCCPVFVCMDSPSYSN